MLCRRRRHLDGGNGKDVVRAITDGVRRVREMTRQVKRFDAQAHRHSSKIVGAIAASGRTATVPTARKEGEGAPRVGPLARAKPKPKSNLFESRFRSRF